MDDWVKFGSTVSDSCCGGIDYVWLALGSAGSDPRSGADDLFILSSWDSDGF